MSDTHYDLIILGAGPGGYVAAERAAARGKSVLLIERAWLGGVCLNEGCVPSKTLLYSAKVFRNAHHSSDYGVDVGTPVFRLEGAMARKRAIMEKLRGGIAYMMKAHKVTVVMGEGTLSDRNTVAVDGTNYTGDNIMIATGSTPIRPPIPGADLPHVMTSTEVLEIEKLPKRIVVIGGGVIGMEFACFFSGVGVEVTVVEMLPEILPSMDVDLAKQLRKALKVSYQLGCRVEEITATTVRFSKGDAMQEVEADAVLMSIGRFTNTKGIGLEAAGVDFDRRGIRVDEQMRTNIPNIYAVGDVTGLSPLAHSASRMGEVAVNAMCEEREGNHRGVRDRMRYHAIPWVVYTDPELAGVGHTEASAKAAGLEVEVGQYQMKANGRFLAEHESGGGVCKVVFDKTSRVLLGVHMIGGVCSEMIFGAAAMIEAEFRVQEIQELVFPHPTVSEVFREAAFNFYPAQ
jgi:dihydrolipoamide dehydrogenase